MRIILYAILWIVLEGSEDFTDNVDYCATRFVNLCRNKGVHVGCKYPKSLIGPKCRNYTKIEFDDKLRHYVTHYLNRRRHDIASGSEHVRRGQVLPRPELMMFVKWDLELAMLAQRLADQCTLVHDDCRATARYLFAGQTIGATKWRYNNFKSDIVTSIHMTIERIFDAWWSEKYKVTVQELGQPFQLDSPWGHFSQLAVWSLKAVGCGAVSHGDISPTFLLVCDFSHNNMLGQKTLQFGTLVPCPSNMIRKPSSLYPLLCAPMTNSAHEIDIKKDNVQPFIYDEEDDDNFKELTRVFDYSSFKREEFTEKYKLHQDFVITTNKNDAAAKVLDKPTSIDNEKHFETVNKIKNQWLTEIGRNEELKIGRNRPTQQFGISTQPYNGKIQQWQTYNVDYKTKETENRQKFMQRRNKPQRDGAKPLFHPNIYDTRLALVSLSRISSVTMDEDIVIQIYNDTGFKKSQ